MAGYINPVDLIAPYLQPLIGSVNTGIEQGLKLGTLQQAINKEKMMEPYYKAHTNLYNAQTAEKLAADEAFKRIIAEGGGGVAGPMTPERALLLHKAGLASPQSWLPTINPVEGAGGAQLIERTTGASTFIPTPGLPPAQKVENIVSGDTTQSVLVDRSGQTSPVMLPRTAAVSAESALNPAVFIFGRDIPGPAEDVGTTAALPGPRFAPKADKDTWSEPYAGPDGSMLQRNLVTGQVHPVIGREPKGTGEDKIAKSANLSAMRTILAARFLPSIPAEKRSLTAGLFITDQFGTSVNPARLRDALPSELQRKWDKTSIAAAEYAKTMSPEAAVEKAWNDFALDEAVKFYKKQQKGKSSANPLPAPAPAGNVKPQGNVNTQALIDEANKAIRAGADPEVVKKRLKEKYGVKVK